MIGKVRGLRNDETWSFSGTYYDGKGRNDVKIFGRVLQKELIAVILEQCPHWSASWIRQCISRSSNESEAKLAYKHPNSVISVKLKQGHIMTDEVSWIEKVKAK